jgi:hypothetical protein
MVSYSFSEAGGMMFAQTVPAVDIADRFVWLDLIDSRHVNYRGAGGVGVTRPAAVMG